MGMVMEMVRTFGDGDKMLQTGNNSKSRKYRHGHRIVLI